MPTLNVTTKTSREVWKSPDGQRIIFEVTMDYEGKLAKAKTYSRDIATEGWSGVIESYEKEGRNGPETFVRQPPKENPAYSGAEGVKRGTTYVPKDEKAIQAMWAISRAVELVGSGATKAEVIKRLPVVHDAAIELYAMVDMVKNSDDEDEPLLPAPEPKAPEPEPEELNTKLVDLVPNGSNVEPENPWKA